MNLNGFRWLTQRFNGIATDLFYVNGAIQRTHIKIPDGFNPDTHVAQLEQQFSAQHGGSWTVESIDKTGHVAYLVRHVDALTTEQTDADSIRVYLAQGTKLSDGVAVATRMKDIHPGYVMTRFEPLKGQATLTKLDADTIRARDALATALGVKPWDIQIRHRPGGGYEFEAPSSYVPSKHDKKLQEAAQTAIGTSGWWTHVDASTLQGVVAPGEKPSFPSWSIPYPPIRQRTYSVAEQMMLPIGMTMAHGPYKSRELVLDLSDSAGVMINGTPGSGKSVTINAIIAGALARGWQLAIGDVPHKAGDFRWCRDYVHPHWFGADSKNATVATVGMVYGVRDERKKLLDHYYVEKWNDLPDNVRPAPILLVIDELTGLFMTEKPPSGIPKDSLEYVEAVNDNLATARLKSQVRKIALELRFVGVRLLLATQQAQGNTGISVPLKMAIPNRILLGVKADKTARHHAFQDPDGAAEVPDIIADDAHMSKGVGVAEIEGERSVVFKSYYGSASDYRDTFARLTIPTTHDPAPTKQQIARYVPRIDSDVVDDGRLTSRLDSEGGTGSSFEPSETVLRGAAKAAHGLKNRL